VNPVSALWFLVFIVVLQQLDGNVFGPRILGDSRASPPSG
jgi:predicted PurR-regulated permease PerM